MIGFASTAIGAQINLALRLGLAVVLLFAAGAKALDQRAFRSELASNRRLAPFAAALGGLVPIAETLLAVGLIWAPTARVAGAATVVLLVGFTAALVLMDRRDPEHAGCACFGAGLRTSTPMALLRNGILTSAAIFIALGSGESIGPRTGTALAAISGAMIVATAALVLLGRYRRVCVPVRQENVESIDGRSVALGTPDSVLLFLHAGCRSCIDLLPEIAGWPGRVDVVMGGSPAVVAPLTRALRAQSVVADGGALRRVYQVSATPSAFKVGRDGCRVGEIATGTAAVRALVVGPGERPAGCLGATPRIDGDSGRGLVTLPDGLVTGAAREIVVFVGAADPLGPDLLRHLLKVSARQSPVVLTLVGADAPPPVRVAADRDWASAIRIRGTAAVLVAGGKPFGPLVTGALAVRRLLSETIPPTNTTEAGHA